MRQCLQLWFLLALQLINASSSLFAGPVEEWAASVAIPPESADATRARHERVAARRKNTQVICHRGAVEFAHENTLEAYRATFELGADGNEIDIRTTKDGVLICFHDDMVDHLVEAYGDTPDFTWNELRRCRFREPGRFGKHCRIPTLVEVFELHRRHAGLIQLDIKRPSLDRGIAKLLDRMDMWDHIVVAPGGELGSVISKDSRFRSGGYKASLYEDHSEVFPQTIAEALKRSGDMLMVEDPRAALYALGRTWRRPSSVPVDPGAVAEWANVPQLSTPSAAAVIAELREAGDWNQPPKSADEQVQSAERILKRARAADAAARIQQPSAELLTLLEERVRNRSLHPDWRYCGLDGAAALRALFALKSDRATELARFCLWRDDPAVEAVQNPMYKTPRSWVDFRTKIIVFDLLRRHRPEGADKLCRDYLAFSETEARRIGIPQFDAATKALLGQFQPANAEPEASRLQMTQEKLARELLRHPRRDVRGRTILECLKHLDQKWADAAISLDAIFALHYALPDEFQPAR